MLIASKIDLNTYQSKSIDYIAIDKDPWATNEEQNIDAFVAIAHYSEGIILKFKVTEPFISVKKRGINNPVYFDNCVEFFVRLNSEQAYYNFEFNCLGSIKAAYGNHRENRQLLPEYLLNSITESVELNIDNTIQHPKIYWELSLRLPLHIFTFSTLNSFDRLLTECNFYKCGGNLPNSHYLSWLPICSQKPDFHKPEFFGKIYFE